MTGSTAELLTVLIMFALVLIVTYLVTRWIAGYQKGKNIGTNVEVIDTFKMAPNKYIQIIRTGQKYVAVAICKDTVTMLTEIPQEQLKLHEESSLKSQKSFRDILTEYKQKANQEEK